MTTLFHVADIHFGAEDKAALAAFEERLAAAPEDSIVVVAGDLTYRGTRSEFSAARDWLASLNRRVVLTAGNHDVPISQIVGRFLKPFGRYAKTLGDSGVQRLCDRDFCLVSVNTARGAQWRWNWAHGAISGSQAEGALRNFEGVSADALRVIVCHHPLILPPGAPIETHTVGGPDAVRAFVQGGVDLILTGHLHMPFRLALPGSDGRAWSIGAGTLSERQRGFPAGFSTVKAKPDGAEATFWAIEGAHAEPEPSVLLPLRPRRALANQR